MTNTLIFDNYFWPPRFGRQHSCHHMAYTRLAPAIHLFKLRGREGNASGRGKEDGSEVDQEQPRKRNVGKLKKDSFKQINAQL